MADDLPTEVSLVTRPAATLWSPRSSGRDAFDRGAPVDAPEVPDVLDAVLAIDVVDVAAHVRRSAAADARGRSARAGTGAGGATLGGR